jgi:hypothetical protein
MDTRRLLTTVVALAALAAIARPAAAQQIPRLDPPRASSRAERLDALRRKLSVGADSLRQPPGVTRLQLPQILAAPKSALAEAPRLRVQRMRDSAGAQCPMPVVSAQRSATAPMPVARVDSAGLEPMPVARGGCVNPLFRK